MCVHACVCVCVCVCMHVCVSVLKKDGFGDERYFHCLVAEPTSSGMAIRISC